MAIQTITPANPIELSNPIEIDGKTCTSLTYDTDELTVAQFSAAEAHAKKQAQKVVSIAEFDYTMHFYLAAYAVIAVNPTIDITDLERVKGRDIMKFVEVGRFFTMSSDEQEESTSDEQSETTHESSQPRSKTSTECE